MFYCSFALYNVLYTYAHLPIHEHMYSDILPSEQCFNSGFFLIVLNDCRKSVQLEFELPQDQLALAPHLCWIPSPQKIIYHTTARVVLPAHSAGNIPYPLLLAWFPRESPTVVRASWMPCSATSTHIYDVWGKIFIHKAAALAFHCQRGCWTNQKGEQGKGGDRKRGVCGNITMLKKKTLLAVS